MSLIMSYIDASKIQELDLIDKSTGQLKLLSAAQYDAMDYDSLRVWCNKNARYGLPTTELIAWLKNAIGGSPTIEIGSGAGDLAFHLGVKGTDSKVQENPIMRAAYASTGQPVITYPDWVEKIDALDAVKKYKPKVVIGQWVTQWIDDRLPAPVGGGSVFGIKEDEILDTGVTYIVIGNKKIHGYKKILQRPHLELKLPFIRSRATYPEENVVYVWE